MAHRQPSSPAAKEAPPAPGQGGGGLGAGTPHHGAGDGMVITADLSRDRSTVRLFGDLDLVSAPHVRWALPRTSGRALVVDLSRLAFIDAAGLSSLLLVRRHLEQAGRRLHLQGAHGLVLRVFQLTGLAHLVEGAA
jgi:anti-anti-sigma factor